jgi:hypothetical protein
LFERVRQSEDSYVDFLKAETDVDRVAVVIKMITGDLASVLNPKGLFESHN